MGVKERREREKIRRNNDIVDAAEKVIFEKGMANATMEDIAREAELGKATIYGYYKGKDEILLAINKRALNKLAELFRNAFEIGSNGMERTMLIGMAYHNFSKDYPNYYHFISLFEMGNMSVDPIKSMENALPCGEILQNAIVSGMNDGSIRDDMQPAILSKMLWGIATGLIQLMTNRGEILHEYHGIKEEEMYEHFFKLMNTALHPQAKSINITLNNN
jgi:AcrR family transcriptional regulator